MSYREIVPHPALRAHVDRLWVSEGGEASEAGEAAGATGEPRRILPDGCMDVLFTPGAEPFVVGAMTRPELLGGGPSPPVVAVRFRPGGAAPFLRVRADELTDRSVGLGQLSARWLSADRVLGRGGDRADGARALEGALLSRLPEVASLDPCLSFAIASLIGPEAPSVDELARRIGWSRQHLGRLVKAHVGLSPKQLARVARMQRALIDLVPAGEARGGRARVAEAAAGQGYYDEAHLALDFRELVGLTPGEVRAGAGSIFPIRSLFAGA